MEVGTEACGNDPQLAAELVRKREDVELVAHSLNSQGAAEVRVNALEYLGSWTFDAAAVGFAQLSAQACVAGGEVLRYGDLMLKPSGGASESSNFVSAKVAEAAMP
jgi:hypothetical protein